MDRIIGMLRSIRKQNDLKNKYLSKYAFIGIGNHSINNLYPVINYLRIPLKYIISKSQDTADLINRNYDPIIGTTDLDLVLSDKEINGVFISASPDSHFGLIKKALLAKKNVFVEKPPCKSIEGLEDLCKIEKESGKTCLVGLQKRYSECTRILENDLVFEDVISYNYNFIVGGYPEGEPLWDLFIHPIDLVSYLFGDAEIISIVKTSRSKGQESVFVHLKHDRIIGSIEMSTQYSWDRPKEYMCINTKKGIYTMENHTQLIFEPKSGTVLSIPKEKIFPSIPELKYLYNGNNFLPIVENNQIVSQGYFSEIRTFVDICEDKKVKNNSSLESLKNTFSILFEIKNQ